jgi:peptidoglycan/xylan/chitin deacetylase (PgdA/CDA1 family)
LLHSGSSTARNIRFQAAVFIVSSLLACSPLRAASHCVILQYHHFSNDTPAITSVTPEQFDRHLEYLKSHDFRVLPLRDVVHALKQGQDLPDRCVSMTVDDATISVYRNAFPRLQKLGWSLTVFVNTEGVDQGIASYMTWEQMRELSRQGVTFENHGHGHIHTIRKLESESDDDWRQRVLLDISTAQRRISDEIGIEPELFAHPYGEYNTAVLAIIQRMGLTGFGQQSGPAWPGADFGALPRFPMAAGFADMGSFKVKINTLPLPVVSAEPADPLVPLQQKRPVLRLTLSAPVEPRSALQCYIGGSNEVSIAWTEGRSDQFTVAPNFDLRPGRHRTNCTLPSAQKGRYHWYSHNWFVRNLDGSWYSEY